MRKRRAEVEGCDWMVRVKLRHRRECRVAGLVGGPEVYLSENVN